MKPEDIKIERTYRGYDGTRFVLGILPSIRQIEYERPDGSGDVTSLEAFAYWAIEEV